MNTVELLLTQDGSHTLRNTLLNENYHSTHGAIQESKHVFIQMGFQKINPQKEQLNILEIGFGTGLNAYLTLLENKAQCKTISYTAIEAFPILESMALQLNYPQLLVNKSRDVRFENLHTCSWNESSIPDEKFSFIKWNRCIKQMNFDQNYDLIYFDAFSPAVQPEMWTEEIFSKLFNCLNDDAFLVTYCAKGEVKRLLKKVGFEVIGIQGPPGKREMTMAFKR